MNIGCVILAGGKSSRMGTDKALLKIEGTSLIEKIAEELEFFDEKIIGRGNREEIPIAGWRNVPDRYSDCGPVGGLHAALDACRSKALFCISCDMPLIKAEFVRDLCDQMEDHVDAVVVKEKNGRIHPVCGVYRKSAVHVFEEQILAGDFRMMRVLERLKVKYVIAEDQEESAQFMNINTPDDLQELKRTVNII